MTQTQSEALRLAEWIDSDFDPDDMYEFGYDQIAAELRRLHGENESQAAHITRLEAEVDHKDKYAEQLGRDLMKADREIRQLRSRPALSDEQITKMAGEARDAKDFAQQIQRHFGIGEPT